MLINPIKQGFSDKETGHQSRYALYQNWCPVVSMGYKKDIFGIFAYEFELLPKNLEFSNLVGGGEPPSVDQWLHHFETAYKNHRDLFLGIYCYAFEQLSYDLLIILHRSVFQPVQNGIYIVES